MPSKPNEVLGKEVPEGKTGLVEEKVSTGEYTVNIVKDYDGKIDPFYLSEKDPDYEYRFLRDDRKNLSLKRSNLLFQKGGWQICPKEHLLRIMHEEELSPDGMCRRGDTILAFMPKDLYKEKQEHKRKLAIEPMDAIKRLVSKGDPNNPELLGVGHERQKGLQTQKDLGM